MNRDTKYIFCHQGPLCDQDSNLYVKTTLPLPPSLHCMCLIANIKRNDFFFDLSTSDKSNSVPQTGWKRTTQGKNSGSGTSWRLSLHPSPRKGCPPSSQKQDGSRRALTQSENNIPSPDVTPSQDALCADISSGDTVAPPSHLKAEPIPFLSGSRTCPQVGTESCYWPAGHSSTVGCTCEWKLWSHFITSPEAPFLPEIAHKASGLPCQLGAFSTCLPRKGERFNGAQA